MGKSIGRRYMVRCWGVRDTYERLRPGIRIMEPGEMRWAEDSTATRRETEQHVRRELVQNEGSILRIRQPGWRRS